MSMELPQWEQQLETILQEFNKQVTFEKNQVFVVGCSTSEVIGQKIGTAGTTEVAEMIFRQLKNFADETGIELAFQCCEHLNRAIVVEHATALSRGLEVVTVVPVRNAGGAMATYAYNHFADPVVVEHIRADAGIDIGDTLIGMHIKHVAVPVRVSLKTLGNANITLATSRPKLIGGARAVYETNPENESC
ncbi:TIGR01440 family protein [Robertmurraya massiliosenegalensis]|uniref:TIGR01440 family protein n=1 Tax=Robertmurraya massiliosenegalensis TaxID=1287657 RepID=UPI0002DE1972|nr:TIGR01440 family protein [Robertmurraya massiliosenegalensis]